MSTDEQTPLGLKLVGDIAGSFLVPAYQRGYRWGDEQVGLLLKDIWENGDRYYCLQPIVVKRQPDGRFELIDGQQRLTTLYLIFLYMKREQLPNSEPPFSIEYETRPRTAAYLETLNESEKDDNIDLFHLHGAYRCISEWFHGHGPRRQNAAIKFYGYLYDRVKVIWYEASHDVDSTNLFTRLNVGRIPLTDAELVKAMLLKRSTPPPEHSNLPSQLDEHRQNEIAAQWDMIERDLHDEGFWAFLTNRPRHDCQTRMELILELMAGTATGCERFQTFFYFKEEIEAHSPMNVWYSVLERYYLLKEWYEDRDLYHKVGYLVAVGESIAGLVNESKSITKSAFQALLEAKIRDRLNLTQEAVEDLDYEKKWNKCKDILLLFNVETVRTLQNSSERYPFHAHKTQQWTLEHIHAQNAEQLNKKEQWQEWLREHRAALAEIRLEDHAQELQRASLLQKIDASFDGIDRESFAQLVLAITGFFNPADAAESAHSMANLALLSGDVNSALGNSVFEVKRRRILECDRRGEYIPICTRRVFLKYYTDAGDQQIHRWSARDRECYIEAMSGVLTRYLKPTPRTAE